MNLLNHLWVSSKNSNQIYMISVLKSKGGKATDKWTWCGGTRCFGFGRVCQTASGFYQNWLVPITEGCYLIERLCFIGVLFKRKKQLITSHLGINVEDFRVFRQVAVITLVSSCLIQVRCLICCSKNRLTLTHISWKLTYTAKGSPRLFHHKSH